MAYSEELTIDDQGLAEFGPLMSEQDIIEGEAVFTEFGTLRRAVMMVGLTKSRDELIESSKTDPQLSAELLDMAVRAYEQHELALEFLQVAMARLITGAAKAGVGESYTVEQETVVDRAIELAFSKARLQN